MEKHLHIISFDVPYPANYGGVIDVFYKIKALHAQGVKIHLHCFEYGRGEAKELDQYCADVKYYKRNMSKGLLLNKLPFVAATRSSEELIQNLLKDKHPILFEGLHCCASLADERLKDRIKIARTHNIEHDYYRNLQKVERSFIKKIYFAREAKKLEQFERVLQQASHIAAISPSDTNYLSSKYKNVKHITAFHPNTHVQIESAKGDFCLYHGNLEVGENNEAAIYLVREVFAQTNIPLVIAGKNPSSELVQLASRLPHISIKANIPTSEIDGLIKKAQINVLPTFQATGIKLKLLVALFSGKHCVVNTPMVANTGLEGLCSVQDSALDMRNEIDRLFVQSFDTAEIHKREAVLLKEFSNKENAEKLIVLI